MAIAKQTTATVIPALQYQDAPAAIDFLCKAFGFEKKAVYESEGGSIAHAQLTLGNGMVMLGSVKEILSGSIPIDTLPKRKDTHWLSRRCGGDAGETRHTACNATMSRGLAMSRRNGRSAAQDLCEKRRLEGPDNERSELCSRVSKRGARPLAAERSGCG